MNFLNIEKKKIQNLIFQYLLHVLCYFQHLKKKLCKNKFSGGGGGGCKIYIFLTLNEKFEILKSAPSLVNWLNGRWFLQIVDGDSGNLYPI